MFFDLEINERARTKTIGPRNFEVSIELLQESKEKFEEHKKWGV